MQLFDNVFNINVNTVRDIQIRSVNFTIRPMAGPKCSGNRSHILWPFWPSIEKLPAFRTVLAKTLSWNWVQDYLVYAQWFKLQAKAYLG